MKPRAMNLDGAADVPSLVGVMVLLDSSGSMASIKQPMEAAFKKFVEDQRATNPDGMWVSLAQFDGAPRIGAGGLSETLRYQQVYDRTPLADVAKLLLTPSGGTPLCDALVRFATDAKAIVDDPTDQTDKLILVVITDGQENASTEHTWAQAKELIDALEGQGCETIWLGTDGALEEVQAQAPTFTSGGASIAYDINPASVAYAGNTLSYAVATSRMVGGSVLRSASLHYQATHAAPIPGPTNTDVADVDKTPVL